MASNNASNTKFVTFAFNWKVDLSQYDKIAGSAAADWPRKYFVTAYKNIVFRWYARLSPSVVNSSVNIVFGIYYEDGPLETINNMEFKDGIVRNDGSIQIFRTRGRSATNRGKGRVIIELEGTKSAVVRAKYGLQQTDSLVYHVSMKIPITAFSYEPPIGIVAPAPNPILMRNADRFAAIQDPESSKFSDAVLISRDGAVFYCHKVIVGQTEPLETILSNPLASLDEEPQLPTDGRGTKRKAIDDSDDNDETSTGAKKKREYDFSHMASSSLKALLEYLYVGQSTLQDLSVTELIEVADSAEQYLLKPLKDSCAAILWKRVVAQPESAFEIARFAVLHEDLKYLKHRALDVLVENYQNFNINPILLPVRFGGTRGEKLTHQLIDYMAVRLRSDLGF